MNNPVIEIKLPKGKFVVFNKRPNFIYKNVKQIHSNLVVDENLADGIIEADGIASSSKIPLCTFTADCLPLIIEGKHGHAILHAGWKGVRDQILLNKKVKELEPETLLIGPHIHQAQYEVQPDFKANFPNSKAFKKENGKLYFSLREEIIQQAKTNYPNIKIIDANVCTFLDNRLHSFRRNKTTERNFNIYIPDGGNFEN